MTLSEYLRTRGLNLDPQTVDEDLVLTEEGLTKEVSDIWLGHKNAVVAVIQARVNALARTLLTKALPEEVLVLRQSMVELGAIIGDFERYHAEAQRRDNKNKVDNSQDLQTIPTEPPKEGQEGSL